MALDWNELAVEAIARPTPRAPTRAARHVVPKLTVTAAAPTRPDVAVYSYGRVENVLREVVTPHYVQPDVDKRQMFRQLYFSPYTPYLGAWGAVLTVETNAVLR